MRTLTNPTLEEMLTMRLNTAADCFEIREVSHRENLLGTILRVPGGWIYFDFGWHHGATFVAEPV